MAKKKYTLYKAESSSAPAPCAFFLSPQGCKNGDKCKFLHVLPTDGKVAPPAAPSNGDIKSISSSDVSSESEEEIPLASTPKNHAKSVDPDDIFAPPGQVPVQPPKSEESKKHKRKRSVEHSDPFAKPRHAADVSQTPDASTNPNTKKKAKVIEKKTSFRDLDLPVASFALPGVHGALANLPVAPPSAAKSQSTTLPVPSSTPEGLKWQKAVIATRSNPKYKVDFDFDRMKQSDEGNNLTKVSDWVKAKPYGSWCVGNPHAIAIDCEMCETKDPVTGASNHKALCRLSVVNAVNPEEVLIDTLVKPDWPVVNHRTWVNGIGKDHLNEVQFTLQHAQAFMMALCSEETVIIGHALQNDLAALKMEHHCNVDSALLFTVKDEPNATCSLKDLAMGILKREMPDVHDSVNDARVALCILEEGYLKVNGKPEPVARSFPLKKKGGSTELFVHRIPKGCFPEHISNMFLTHTHIKPKEVPQIEFNSDTGKTTVSFISSEHANIAFKTIEGEAKPDKSGRLQKRVYLRNGGYVNVRKMTRPKQT
jgi:RNA exonuclease 1